MAGDLLCDMANKCCLWLEIFLISPTCYVAAAGGPTPFGLGGIATH